MILADHVHHDSMTGKKYILGAHNGIISSTFPAKHSFSVYLALTAGHGRVMLRMRIVDADEASGSIQESISPLDMANPNQVYEVTATIAAVFPTPGDYRVQLFVGNDLLREVRLRVALRQTNTPPSGER